MEINARIATTAICEIRGQNDAKIEGIGRTRTVKTIMKNKHTSKLACAVTFSTVEIKEYPIIIGDNPSVSRGVPLSIGWIPLAEEQCYTLDDYEEQRPSVFRRVSTELRKHPLDRIDMMRSLGYCREDIRLGTKAANIKRHQRARTRETMSMAPVHEACEKVARAVRNATVRRTEKKNERRMLQRYCQPILITGECLYRGSDCGDTGIDGSVSTSCFTEVSNRSMEISTSQLTIGG